MEKIESEKIFIIAAAVVVCAFLAVVTVSSMNTNALKKQMYDACIAKGGSWLGTNDEICIQRGSF